MKMLPTLDKRTVVQSVPCTDVDFLIYFMSKNSWASECIYG